MYSALRHPVIALLFVAVAGCGQIGPLYLPDEVPAPDNGEPATEDSATAADAAKPDEQEG